MLDIIEGKNIIFRKATQDDLDSIFQNVWSDENIYKYLFIKPALTKEEAKEKLDRTITFQKENLAYFVALKETNEVIGFVGLKEDSPKIYSETGICIASKYQGKGLGKELMTLLLDLTFNKLKAKRLIYAHMKHNQKSKNLCLSFNFKYYESNEETREYDNYKVICDYYYLDYEDYIIKNKE